MIEYRADSLGNVHGIVGKVSFDEKALQENLTYFNDLELFFRLISWGFISFELDF